MADVLGRSGLLAISSDGIAYTTIGGITDMNLDNAMSLAEVTDHDAAPTQFLGDRPSATGGASGNYDEADAGQAMLWTAIGAGLAGGPLYYFRYRPETGGGKAQYIFQAIVTGDRLSSPNTGKAPFELEFQVSGGVTKSNQ